ncbi:HK97 gp10 family phage protein [Salinicoccus roseus]|uniref:HK97 gp10 family phage protein n=1 Tax=Salinicoccus roseus TaxID=45670 RepID=A0A0C2HK41_9STAP|nr:HK97 gp10 family phage protein [Salinicoccus roseus]KIH69941.1 HK97 gp10 family phage protein [Salinicoccus roseus]MDB0581237.1 HK97 gp10 family phage protein [Salinicoccus roseus]
MKDLVTALQAYSDRTKEVVEQGVSETALILDTEASSRVKVDTGMTKNSIQSDIGGLEASVSVGAYWAVFLEFGTGIYATGPGGSRAKKLPWTYKGDDGKWYTTYGMVAQPFWYPSIDVARKFFSNYFS